MRFLSSLVRGIIVAVAAICFLSTLPALAQNSAPVSQVVPGSNASISPKKGVVPAPANAPPSHLLSAALTPQTRQTLQEAMDSGRAAIPAK